MSETYFITGGAGNLARQIAFELVGTGNKVVLFDCAAGPAMPVTAGCHYIQGDITRREDIAAALGKHRPQIILHFASLLSGSSEADRELAWRVNMDGTFHLLEESIGRDVIRIVFPSSLAAYGTPLPTLVPEDHPQWPVGLYGVTKVAVERLGHYYRVRHGLDFRCLRLPIVVSPYAVPGAASAYASMAFIEATRDGNFVFRVRPTSRPALIYFKDALKAVVLIARAPAARLTRPAYSIQALSPTARQLADAIQSRLPRANLTFAPDPKIADLIDSWPIEFDDTSARHEWGWQPDCDLDVMSDGFVDWLRRGK